MLCLIGLFWSEIMEETVYFFYFDSFTKFWKMHKLVECSEICLYLKNIAPSLGHSIISHASGKSFSPRERFNDPQDRLVA